MGSLLFALIIVPLALVLLFSGESAASKGFACMAVALGLAPLLLAIAGEKKSRAMRQGALLLFLLAVAAGGWLYAQAPTGQTPDSACIRHCYSGGKDGFRRAALGNLLPELDQFLMGFKLVPFLDPLFTQEQAADLSRWTARIYQELEADADFHALGSAMPHAYDDLWFGRRHHGHSYLYRPASLIPGRPAPVLVFLHGSGGNFKAYPWLLRTVAEHLGAVLICPSYGMGDWDADTAKTLRQAVDDAAQVQALDRQNMHLLALSNGGKGFSRAGKDLPGMFQSAVLVSPVLETARVADPMFAQSWQGKPVFVITGTADDRIPLESVTSAAAIMEKAGIPVTLEAVPDADHFLLFSHREQVMAQLQAWLQKNVRPARAAPGLPAPGSRGRSG